MTLLGVLLLVFGLLLVLTGHVILGVVLIVLTLVVGGSPYYGRRV